MPQYFTDEIPYTRRDCRKDLKIYRNKRQLSGPNLISKYVWFEDSHPTFYKFIEDNGSFKKYGNLLPCPSIVAASKILHDGFNICYSVNKRQRWELIDQLSKSLYSLQDPSIGLRVSLLRVEIDLSCKRGYEHPEFMRDDTMDSTQLIDFRGFNGEDELYIKRRNATFADVYRHSWVSEYLRDILPKERLRKRRRKPRPEILHVMTEEEREREREVPLNERKTHVIIKEQICRRSARRLNMDEDLIAPKEDFPKKLRARQQKKMHRKQRRKSKHPTEGKIGKKAASSIVPSTTEWMMVEPMEFMRKREVIYNDRPTMKTDFCDLVIVRQCCKAKRRKNKPKICNSDEYELWLRSCAHIRQEQQIMEDSVTEVEVEENESRFSPLDAFLIPIDRHETFTSAVKQLFPRCQHVENIYPDNFICEIDNGENVPSILADNLRAFDGIVILQDLLVASGEKFIRCILNRKARKEIYSSDDDEKIGTASIRDKILPIKWGYFMPSERIAKSTCYRRKQAELVALSYALERFRSHNFEQREIVSRSSTTSRHSHCGICDESSDDGFALGCQHFFCRDCWAHYAYLKIENAQVPITCIEYKCDELIHPDQLLIILPVTLCDRYKRLLHNSQLMRSEWIYCAKCTRVMHLERNNNEEAVVAVCECGTAMCVKCGQRSHIPLSCADARFYCNAIETNGRNFHMANDERSVIVKQCPDCGQFCERTDGCNHMECPCGADFCYVCGKTFYDKSVNHYECTNDVSVRIDLFDVPRIAFNKLSLTTFEQCLHLRHAREGQQLHAFRKHLMRILRYDDDEVYRILQLYRAACESLELGLLGSHLLRRHSKHIKNQKMLIKTVMVTSSLNTSLMRLHFFVRGMKRKLAETSVRRSDFIAVTRSVESALRNYLLEASWQTRTPVITVL